MRICQGVYHLVYPGGQIEGASHFRSLKSKVKKQSMKYRTTLALWISDTSWKLTDQRMALGRKISANQGERRVLTRRFQAALKEYRRSRARRAGEEINALVSKNQVREA